MSPAHMLADPVERFWSKVEPEPMSMPSLAQPAEGAPPPPPAQSGKPQPPPPARGIRP